MVQKPVVLRTTIHAKQINEIIYILLITKHFIYSTLIQYRSPAGWIQHAYLAKSNAHRKSSTVCKDLILTLGANTFQTNNFLSFSVLIVVVITFWCRFANSLQMPRANKSQRKR